MKLWEHVAQRYHKDIGFPAGVAMPVPGAKLIFTDHARDEARVERIKNLPRFVPKDYDVVEVSVVAGMPVKWVVRFPWPEREGYDIVMVLNPTYSVSTVWMNSHHDTHATLRRHLYARP